MTCKPHTRKKLTKKAETHIRGNTVNLV